MTIVLVTGPSRSGKSAFAEQAIARCSRATSTPVVYVATARRDPDDPEWETRIARHRQLRPANWTTLEIPKALPEAIASAHPDRLYLVDSLGTWVANWIESSEEDWKQQVEQLLDNLRNCPTEIFLVAEEVGWGVVPAYKLGRVFRDRLGTLCQNVGHLADDVYLVVAGYAINIAEVGTPVDPQL